MSLTKVWIEEGCTACGVCSDICPSVIKMDDVAEIIEGVDYSSFEAEIKDAAESCPVEIIKFE